MDESRKGATEKVNVIEKLRKIEEMTYAQMKVIDLLCGIIDEQFQLLMQYMTAEELERSPLLESIKGVSELQAASEI